MIIEVELDKMTEYAEEITVYNDGESAIYPAGNAKFNEICAEWNSMLNGAHQMPAFGVSLHHETVREIKSGVWVEFGFGKVLSSDGMPYEKLLVNVQPDWSGFNIRRYNSECGYDGRCFYYDLVGKDMSAFYDCLIK